MSDKKEYFPLTPAQEMIAFMLKYSFFHKQVIQIPASIMTEKEIDFSIMQKAIKKEIERNDCMRLRFEKKGSKIRQYFLNEYVPNDYPVISFKTKEEQEEYLGNDASTTVHCFKGETYRIILFRAYDGRYGIYINVCHLAMDAAAVFVFFSDLLATYEALRDNSEMPKPLGSFKDVIKKELAYINNAEKVKKDEDAYREFFLKDGEPIYNGVHGCEKMDAIIAKKKDPSIRQIDVFDPIHDRAYLQKKPVSKEESKVILDYMSTSGVSPECLVQLGMRLHVSKINHRRLDTFFLSLCTRRRTVSEKRCGGSMTAALPWRIVLNEDLTFKEALGKMQELQGWMFRHMDYPFLSWRELESKLFNYSPAAGSTSMMFSWFPLESGTMNNWDYEFTGYSLGRYVMPLYSYAMKDAKNDCLKFAYLHRPNYITKEHIDALHDNTIKALVAGCTNPDMTLGEILNLL